MPIPSRDKATGDAVERALEDVTWEPAGRTAIAADRGDRVGHVVITETYMIL
jgi:hypothetical protein